MKKLLPISMLAMVTVCPAFADIDNESMCVVGTLNESSNNGNAGVQAIWTGAQYSEDPGYYLLYDSTNGTITQHVTCPANSYCPGFANETFADASIGIISCSNGSNIGGNYSDAGATRENLCYDTITRTCAVQNPLTVPHGTVTYANQSATTKEYYDYVYIPNDTLACAATVSCDTGYTATSKGALADYVNIQVLDYDDNYYRAKSNSGTRTDGNNAAPLSAGSWEIKWKNGTTVSGISSCNTTRNDIVYYITEFADNNITAEQMMTALYSVTTPEQFTRLQEILTQYQSGDITFEEAGTLIYKEFNINTSAQFTQNSTGANCWCKMTGYTLTGQSAVDTSSNTGWVWWTIYDNANNCADYCAHSCASRVSYWTHARAAVFGEYGEYPTCTPNTINLTWYSVGDTVYETNTCTYDQPITLPATNPTRTGYIFSGWRLRTTPAQ